MTVVLVAHGSRDARFALTARRVAAAVRAELSGVRVELAYLDLNEPLVGDVLAALSDDVTVVPLLFGDGFHSKIDLPAIIADARRRNPAVRPFQSAVLGVHSPVLGLVDRLVEAGLRDDDGVLMYAVGSSDASSDESIRARGRELSRVLGMPVETVFATRLGPEGAAVRGAVDRLHEAGARRIAASPLFLSAGLLTDRVEASLDAYAPDSLVAGPIGAHPALIAAVRSLAVPHLAPLPAP
ncbi:hypothetical protein nbrc107696_39830 [Gordonia spumicola]|uniref:Cobalamin biosynthesis protein CbiX n=1 Tax=Gordonia spumicola TaxID=589161 RepID=A0A7I9VDZ2_9ACTN|nr:CbiX/SirB N-terminal domain-containing protein [Gordonia spumicola]GEE03537.1 hypothetical protein nbrc107696_39830 [Gordonia spumicola]